MKIKTVCDAVSAMLLTVGTLLEKKPVFNAARAQEKKLYPPTASLSSVRLIGKKLVAKAMTKTKILKSYFNR